MENRFILVGLTILVVSIIFIVYGLVVTSDRTVGVALSIAVVGIVFVFTGVGYGEPAEHMLNQYAEDLNMFLTRVIEDMGIPDRHRVKLCYLQKIFCLSEGGIPCNNIVQGIGMVNSIPYVAISAEHILNFLSNIAIQEDLVDKFKRIFIDIAAVCRGIAITKQDNVFLVEFVDLTDKGFNYIKTPINLVKLYTIALLAQHFGRDVEVIEEIISQESYKIKVRIESAKYD